MEDANKRLGLGLGLGLYLVLDVDVIVFNGHLYKMDTYLRRIVVASPDGVHLRET